MAFALKYAFLTIFLSWYTQSVVLSNVKLRSRLIALIYHKTPNITSKEVYLGPVVVLMNIDVEKILSAVKNMHKFRAIIISGSIALYIPYAHLGVSFVAPLITILVAIAFIMSC